jgi:hypothetical protein
MKAPSTILASDRRRFLKLVGFAGLSSAVGASMSAWAQTKPASPAPATSPPPAPAPPDSTAAPQKPEISEDAKALAKILERRYGKFLDAKQIEKLPEEVENRLQGGKRLRDSKLANSDEPDFVFRA